MGRLAGVMDRAVDASLCPLSRAGTGWGWVRGGAAGGSGSGSAG